MIYTERWDLYDENKNIIEGASHVRDSKEPIADGRFHIAVWLFMVTKEKKIFITQRAATKSRAFLWEASGGSVLAGESPVEACVRELKEETSIEVKANEIVYFDEERGKDWILEYYYVVVDDIDVESLKLQEEEVADAKLILMDELLAMESRGELVNGVKQGFEKVLDRV